MDFSLSEEQEAIAELAGQILGEAYTDEALRNFEKSSELFDKALWKQLAEANLLGIAVDDAHDGMGMGLLELCLLIEAQGRAVAPLPVIAVLAEAALPISEFGSDAQKQALLPGLVSGDHWVTSALQEGTNPAEAPGTTATGSGSGVVLNGTKSSVAVAEGARAILVSARDEAGNAGLYLVEPSAAGVSLEAHRATNHARVFTLTLDGAAAEALGDGGADALPWTLARARVAWSALGAGVSAEAVKQTAEYVSNRKQFGRPIGTFQGVALRMADAYIDLQCQKSALWQAIFQLDEGRDAAASVAVAKWWACRGGQRVVHSAQHLHGGIGSDVEFPIHRFFLWAKTVDVALGGGAQQLVHLGDELAKDRA